MAALGPTDDNDKGFLMGNRTRGAHGAVNQEIYSQTSPESLCKFRSAAFGTRYWLVIAVYFPVLPFLEQRLYLSCSCFITIYYEEYISFLCVYQLLDHEEPFQSQQEHGTQKPDSEVASVTELVIDPLLAGPGAKVLCVGSSGCGNIWKARGLDCGDYYQPVLPFFYSGAAGLWLVIWRLHFWASFAGHQLTFLLLID